jgi:hypothetical protein
MSCLSDVMFVNGIPFVVSVAHGLNLVAAKNTLFRLAKNLAVGIKGVMALYSHCVFHVGTILMDNKFEKLIALVPKIVVNTTAAKEHMQEVKSCIWLIKEQRQGILNTRPIQEDAPIPRGSLAEHLPPKTGVAKVLLSCKIVIFQKLDFAKHCQAVFGLFCEVHNKPTPSNMMVT